MKRYSNTQNDKHRKSITTPLYSSSAKQEKHCVTGGRTGRGWRICKESCRSDQKWVWLSLSVHKQCKRRWRKTKLNVRHWGVVSKREHPELSINLSVAFELFACINQINSNMWCILWRSRDLFSWRLFMVIVRDVSWTGGNWWHAAKQHVDQLN